MQNKVWIFGLLILFVAFTGCASDPAADKPDAEVTEAQPEAAPSGDGATLSFSDESTVSWVGSKVTGSHDGGFNEFTGEIQLVDGDPTASSVMVTIDTTSIWSDNDNLTGHLKSEDFFAVESFPTATFQSTSIEAVDGGYSVTGNLNLHGVEKSITFPADISVDGMHVMVNAEFSIKRFDFGIEYKGPADNLIRDEVVIKLALHAGAAMADATDAADAATEEAAAGH